MLLRLFHQYRSCKLFILVLLSSASRAGFVNRTIDDEYGDSATGQKLEYNPSGPWQQGATCQMCAIHLEASRVRNGTWHDASMWPDDEIRSVTARFNGSAVYVYNTLASYTYQGEPTITYLTFELDGSLVGTYLNNRIEGITYNVPVYANVRIPEGAHTLVIRVLPGSTGRGGSLALFDYIEYTTGTIDPSTTPPAIPNSGPGADTTAHVVPSTSPLNSTSVSNPIPPSNTPAPPAGSANPMSRRQVGALAGGILGGLAAVGLVVYLVRRRRIGVYPFMEASALASPRLTRGPATPDAAHSASASVEPLQEQRVEAAPPQIGDVETSLRAEMVGLREQVMRMQELIAAPPSYHSAPEVVRQAVQQVSPRAGGKRARARIIPG